MKKFFLFLLFNIKFTFDFVECGKRRIGDNILKSDVRIDVTVSHINCIGSYRI